MQLQRGGDYNRTRIVSLWNGAPHYTSIDTLSLLHMQTQPYLAVDLES